MADIVKDWEQRTVQEREVFISHTAADLIDEMKTGRDVNGLQVIHDNLTVLTEYAEKAINEVELAIKRQAIIDSIGKVYQYMQEGTISFCIAEWLEDIAAEVELYSEETSSPEIDEYFEQQALNNIQAGIDGEVKAIEAELEA